jgi:hypothetical protein
MSRKKYERELKRLHVELVRLQDWVREKGLKLCVVLEGRDGAGKGGAIKAITERVSPRTFRVVALPAPTERENTQMYLQRYIPHLPAAGEIVIFDRAGTTAPGWNGSWDSALSGGPPLPGGRPDRGEAMVDSGILLIKYWPR